MSESTLERVKRRLGHLQALRAPFEPEWRDIAKYAAPNRSRFLSDGNGKRKRSPIINDEHGIFAFRTLAAGMHSGLSSPSRPWFNLAAPEELMEDYEVKVWLSECERRMYAFLAATNFYGAVKTGYHELGLFGTDACVMVEHQKLGAVCHALTAGEYWLATSDTLQADTLYRRCPMNVRQAVDTFGNAVSKQVRDKYDRSTYDDMVAVYHAIEPNKDRDERKIDGRNKPWRSIYWEEGGDAQDVLRVSGYDEQPFWAPRWDTLGGDAYGFSPGMDALPSLRELQLQVRRGNEGVDLLIKPEKLVKAGITLTGQPGNNVSVANLGEDAVRVAWSPQYQAVEIIDRRSETCRRKIDQAAYADLFMAITNMQGIQPRNIEEIASRNEEKLTQLGPVIERVNNEKLEVAIDRTFGIMSRGRLLPPPPETVQGQALEIKFVSILTQMQRMVGIGQIERTVAFIGNLSGRFPEAADKLDVDEMIDDYADRAGAPQKIIRTSEQVKAMRAQRAQQMQAQQAAATMPAVRDGAEAARLLAETDAGGGSLLDRIMPA